MFNGYSFKFARFFFEFRRKISQDFAPLFEQTGNETTKGVSMNSKWGWYNILYGLANNNILNIDKITKIPILQTLTYLAYMQDYNNKQKNNYDNI